VATTLSIPDSHRFFFFVSISFSYSFINSWDELIVLDDTDFYSHYNDLYCQIICFIYLFIYLFILRKSFQIKPPTKIVTKILKYMFINTIFKNI